MSNEELNQQTEQQPESLETNESLNMNLRHDNGQVEDVVQQEAKQYGHKSKEEWIAEGKDPAKWKSEQEYVEYGRNYQSMREDIIKSLKSELADVKHVNREILDYHKKQTEEQYKRAKMELEQRLNNSRDVNEIKQLATQKAELETSERQQAMDNLRSYINRVNADFVDRNKSWYNDSNPELKQEANSLAASLMALNPNNDHSNIAKQVEDIMKVRYPKINVRTPTPPMQFSASKSSVNKTSMEQTISEEDKGYKSLTPDQQQEYNNIKKSVEGINDRFPNSKYKTTYTVSDYLKAVNKR